MFLKRFFFFVICLVLLFTPTLSSAVYFGLHFEGAGQQIVHEGVESISAPQQVIGVQMVTSYRQDLQFDLLANYRSVDIRNLDITTYSGKKLITLSYSSFLAGASFFPNWASFFLFGFNSPTRWKISMLGGFGLSGDDIYLTGLASIGLVFGSWRDPSGPTIEFVFRPSHYHYYTDPNLERQQILSEGSYTLRIGFLFNPFVEEDAEEDWYFDDWW